MTRVLAPSDRAARAFARWVERPTLSLVASQTLLRRIFAISAPLGQRWPAGVTRRTDPDGTLHAIPSGSADAAPILYFHGGGFTIGSPRTHASLIAHLAKFAGRPVIGCAYRLAPRHPFPAARDDAIAAYDRLCEAGTPPVAVAGDSAGGCLALMVAQHARDAGLPRPSALALIGPLADLSVDLAATFAEARDEILIPPVWPRRILPAYLQGQDASDPRVSPLLGDLSGLPPTLIQVGSSEALRGQAERLVALMPDARLDLWDGLQHVWHLRAGLCPAATKAVSELGDFIRAQAP